MAVSWKIYLSRRRLKPGQLCKSNQIVTYLDLVHWCHNHGINPPTEDESKDYLQKPPAVQKSSPKAPSLVKRAKKTTIQQSPERAATPKKTAPKKTAPKKVVLKKTAPKKTE